VFVKLKICIFCCLCTIVGISSTIVDAEEANENLLKGTFTVRGETIIDPPKNEPKDTHMAFFLEGQAAQKLYDMMKVTPVRDECIDDGSITKSLGEMRCTKFTSGRSYECAFALDVANQKIVLGIVC